MPGLSLSILFNWTPVDASVGALVTPAYAREVALLPSMMLFFVSIALWLRVRRLDTKNRWFVICVAGVAVISVAPLVAEQTVTSLDLLALSMC